MVKNNKTAIKGLLVLGGVSTAAASVFTLSKNMQKNYYTDIINKKIEPDILVNKNSISQIFI